MVTSASIRPPITVSIVVGLIWACSSSGGRQPVAGGPLAGGGRGDGSNPATASASGASTASDTSTGSTTNTDTGLSSGVHQGAADQGGADLRGETIESCAAANKNWVAVVNGGSAVPTCGEPLVSWCCSRPEIKARFPGFAPELELLFTKLVDVDKLKLYHCSSTESVGTEAIKTTFHLAKIVNGQTCYKTVYVTGSAAAASGADEACPAAVSSADLVIDGPACDDSVEDSGTGALTFADDIKPILIASCSGSTCHDSGSTEVDPSLQFNTDEALFQENRTAIGMALASGTEPPAASGKTLATEQRDLIFAYFYQETSTP